MTLAASASYAPMTLIGDLFEHAAEAFLPPVHATTRAKPRTAPQVPSPAFDPASAQLRWLVLAVLQASQPLPALDRMILAVIQACIPDAHLSEAHAAMTWLATAGLVNLQIPAGEAWSATLSPHGQDVADYQCDAPAGIARPAVYW